ncbi:MAG: CHAD domain-containing protein [Pseudanabaenaceae cyanobacterium bins.68]|nr:CHAD domain-containing protein [Pseudanabaenaceae cyanobacterium bins.68]
MESSLWLQTLGKSAYQAIALHGKKLSKRQAELYQSESIHQMRVELRRLGSAIQLFAPALKLPNSCQPKQLRKIGRHLGAVRDLDILLNHLHQNYLPILPSSEAETLKGVTSQLEQQRHKALGELKQALKNDTYQATLQGLNDWLEQPKFRAIADIPLAYAFPTLLLPLLSQLLMHPGWFVGVDLTAHQFLAIDHNYLTAHQIELHDLRKNIKQVRYQAEFFLEFYGDEFAQQVQNFAKAQNFLGFIQDRFVLEQSLSHHLKQDLTTTLPHFAAILNQHQLEDWQSWQMLQQNYLNPQARNLLYQAMVTPKLEPLLAIDRCLDAK